MNISRALVAAVIGLALLPMRGVAADDVLHRVELATPLSPVLRNLVTEVFPKDEELREYLIPDELDWSPSHLPKLFGATFRANRKGDIGAIIVVYNNTWCGSIGCPLHIFLKRNGKWRQVSHTVIASGFHYSIDVLQTTDHGFYRLDLGPERDCEENGHVIDTDGIMIWKGKEYDRLHPCLDDPIGGTLDRAQDIPYTPSQE